MKKIEKQIIPQEELIKKFIDVQSLKDLAYIAKSYAPDT